MTAFPCNCNIRLSEVNLITEKNTKTYLLWQLENTIPNQMDWHQILKIFEATCSFIWLTRTLEPTKIRSINQIFFLDKANTVYLGIDSMPGRFISAFRWILFTKRKHRTAISKKHQFFVVVVVFSKDRKCAIHRGQRCWWPLVFMVHTPQASEKLE